MALPAAVLEGDTLKASADAAPGVMLKFELTAWERPLEEASREYAVPVLLMLKPLNVATPALADWVVVPESVPLPGLVLKPREMLAFEEVMVLPLESCTVTWMLGIAAPATEVEG